MIKDRALSPVEKLALFFRQQWSLQQARRYVFMLTLHADVQRDVRAMHKIKQTPTETLVASQIVRSSGLPPPSLVSIVELDSEVIEETIHPHTSTPWSPGLWGHSANPAASMTGQTVTRKTRTHTHDISSLVSVSQTASHTHADTHTQAYTLWHFLVKRTSVCSPSHHHHHNQRSFVAG